MPQQHMSPLLAFAGIAVVALLIGGAAGYYVGLDQGAARAAAATAQQAQENPYADVDSNPLGEVRTNPYSDVKVNPFE